MERVGLRIQVLRGEYLGQLNVHFRRKVQLKEELDENEVQIHFKRGVMEGLLQAQNAIEEIQKSDKLEVLRSKNQQIVADTKELK